jgi:hypothetical protein
MEWVIDNYERFQSKKGIYAMKKRVPKFEKSVSVFFVSVELLFISLRRDAYFVSKPLLYCVLSKARIMFVP